MSIVSDLMGGGASGILQGIGQAAIGIRTALTGEAPLDSNKRAELVAQAAQIESQLILAQIAVNKAEAESPSIFKGGWRPAVGWVCVTGLVYSFFLQPLLPWTVGVLHSAPVAPLPTLDTSTLMTLLLGMLGLGGMRTFEKGRGV
ncbi:MAG: 3TM-type holin [Dehalococcoidales bacterium]